MKSTAVTSATCINCKHVQVVASTIPFEAVLFRSGVCSHLKARSTHCDVVWM